MEKNLKNMGMEHHLEIIYVDDIVSGVVAFLNNTNDVKCEVYNLGNSNPVSLNDFICEKVVGKGYI